jgi:transcriptional regulator with XRE-family HTH domain
VDTDQLRCDLGRAIAARRVAANLTQEQLGEAVDYSTEWISRIERGLALPKLEKLVAIGDAVGVSADRIMADVLAGDARRASVQRLLTNAEGMPDPVVEALADIGATLGERWPRS